MFSCHILHFQFSSWSCQKKMHMGWVFEGLRGIKQELQQNFQKLVNKNSNEGCTNMTFLQNLRPPYQIPFPLYFQPVCITDVKLNGLWNWLFPKAFYLFTFPKRDLSRRIFCQTIRWLFDVWFMFHFCSKFWIKSYLLFAALWTYTLVTIIKIGNIILCYFITNWIINIFKVYFKFLNSTNKCSLLIWC